MATQPTLAMIPSGYKDGKLYSVLPSDGVGDFDVTRGSNATRINKDGLIETVTGNTPRLNYPLIDGVVSGCPSLLLEPQSLNIVKRSQELSISPWILSGGTVSDNFVISPDGTLNGSEIGSVNGNVGGVYQTLTSLVSGDIYTVSFYGKSGTASNLCLVINDTTAWNTIGGKEFTSADGLNNLTWTRFEYTFAVTSTAGFNIHIGSHSEIGMTSQYLGDFFVYGVQAEKLSHSTSYIKTNGTAISRLADTANNAGNASTFNDSEGVLFAEISALANDLTTTSKPITISQSSTNLLGFYYFQSRIDAYVRVNGVNQFSKSHSLDPTINNKISLKYKTNDFALWINGFEIATDTNGTTPSGLNQLRFDDLSDKFYGKTKQLQYFNTALTDLELETLTSFTSFNAMALAQNYTI